MAIDNFAKNPILGNMHTRTKVKVKILIPSVQRYKLTYRKGAVKQTYEISPPIEKTDEMLTVWAFGRGVRSFKIDNIIDIETV